MVETDILALHSGSCLKLWIVFSKVGSGGPPNWRMFLRRPFHRAASESDAYIGCRWRSIASIGIDGSPELMLRMVE